MKSSCDWSYSGKRWQKCIKSDLYWSNSCKKNTSAVKGDYLSTDIGEISEVYVDSSTTTSMQNSTSPIKDGFVYKRRKIQRNTITLLSGQKATEVIDKKNLSDFDLSSSGYHLALPDDSSDDVHEAISDHSRDCEDNEEPSFSGRNHLVVHTTFKSQPFAHKNLEYVPIREKVEQSSDSEVSHSTKDLTNELCTSLTRNCNATSDTFVTSNSYVPSTSFRTVAGEHSGECSNSNGIPKNFLEMFKSPVELCICVLKQHGLLRNGSRNSAHMLPKKPGSVGLVLSPCKICGLAENALKMLICDGCEESFHLSCCKPKIKRPPKNEWYCQFCFTEKQNHLLMKNVGTSSVTSDETPEGGGLISSMLRGIYPHRSRARVGDDFQVEVPDWSFLTPYDDDYFGNPKEMDEVDYCRLEGWSWRNSSKSSSIGNWLQCKDEDDNGNTCGKWRRAPLFSVQTDDWDCSCALPWDPIHADCSVPQELDTEVVLKHLKHIEMFKTRLNNRMKPV